MSGFVKHQPATPLPPLDVLTHTLEASNILNAEYLARSGHAYPKLVEALLYSVSGGSSDPTCIENPHDRALRVLREIGEGE